jgi:hypothetical protein
MDWDANACWLGVNPTGVRAQNCPAGVKQGKQTFGSLTLISMSAPCVDVPVRSGRESLILWQMKPGQTVVYHGEKKKEFTETADPGGMWLVSENVSGRVCQQSRPER